MADFSSVPTLVKGESDMDDINAWWRSVHQLYQNDRPSFDAYVAANPDMGVRWHARAANDSVNTGDDNSYHNDQAQMLSYQIATGLGYGTDMKQDGKMVAWNYDDWNDISNEWGKGDFWKIGTPSALNGGLMDFIEDNPFQIAAIVGSAFIPMMAPAVASALGVSNAVATGILSSGLTAVGGGDIQDIVTAGVTAWGLEGLSEWAGTQVSDAVAADPTLAANSQALVDLGVTPELASQASGDILNAANTAVPGTLDVTNQVLNNGPDAALILGELNNSYNDYMGGTQPPGSGSYDNPILDYPGTLPSNPDAGGSTATPGETVGEQPAGGDPAASAPPAQGEDLNDRDEWVYSGGILTNNVTGAQRPGGSNMVEGTIYRGDGDVVGQEEEDGLVVGGSPVANPNTIDSVLGGMVRGDILGDWASNWDPTAWGGGNPSPGAPGGGQGGQDPGPGIGDGTQVGDSTNQVPGGETGIDFPLPIPIPIPGGDNQSYSGNVPPQDMSTLYEKPTYEDAEMRPLLNVPQRQMQAPMVTPADNSGQASYDEWLQDYMASQEGQDGLLPMIAGKRTDRGLI